MEKMTNVNVDRIKEIAKSKGMTMTHLCSLIGKYPTFLSCVRNGTDRIDRDNLSIIALVLNTTVAYLTNETDDPTSATIHTERMGYLTRVLQTLTPSDFNKVEKLAEYLLCGKDADSLLSEGAFFCGDLAGVSKELSPAQRKDIFDIACDIAGQLDPDDDPYIPIGNEQRDLIASVATMRDDISPVKRAAVNGILGKSDAEIEDEQELSEVYWKLNQSGRRQLMGKAYELLDSQNNPQAEAEATPPDIDMVAPILDRGVKK